MFLYLFVPDVLCSWMWALTKPLLTQRDLPGLGCKVMQRPTYEWRGGGHTAASSH